MEKEPVVEPKRAQQDKEEGSLRSEIETRPREQREDEAVKKFEKPDAFLETDNTWKKIETKELPPKLYRSVSVGELFLLWRDKQLPLGAFPGHEDSGAEPGSVQTFWFDQPYRFMKRPAMLEVETEHIQSGKVQRGIMKYDIPPTSLEIDDAAFDDRPRPPTIHRQVEEYYVAERLPLSKVEVFIEKDEQEILHREKESAVKLGLDFFDFGEDVVDLKDILIEVIVTEFGTEEKNFPPNLLKVIPDIFFEALKDPKKKEEYNKTRKELLDSDWVELGRSELLEGVIYIKRGGLKEYVSKILPFVEYLDSLRNMSVWDEPDKGIRARPL